jgi:hypothetical protein
MSLNLLLLKRFFLFSFLLLDEPQPRKPMAEITDHQNGVLIIGAP